MRPTGPTHLTTGEDLEEKVSIPSGLEASSLDARALDGLLPQGIEAEMAQHREVLSRMPCPDPALILMEGDIEHIMDLILDAPVTADRVPEGTGREGTAEQIGAILDGMLTPDAALGPHQADGSQARPGMPGLDPANDCWIIDHPGMPGLDAAMPGLDGLSRIMPDPREVVSLGHREAQPHVLVEGALIGLEGQDVGPLLVEHLLGNLPLAAHGIDRHYAAGQGQAPQEVGQGG